MRTKQANLTLAGFGTELGKLEKDLHQLTYEDVFRTLLPNVQSGIAMNFAETKSPEGQAWAPRKSGGDWPLLIKSGVMFQSIVEQGPGGFINVSPDQLLLGTEVEYAGFHETGTSRMPARPFMGLNDNEQDKLGEALADAILDELGVG